MVIKITGHSAESLQKAARQVEKYRDKLIDNNAVFLSMLMDDAIVQTSGLLSSVAHDYEPPDFETQDPLMSGGSSPKMSATLSLVGEDAAFVEFGAGIHYNPTPNSSSHPKGVELGYTIGSYGMHQGLQDEWHYRSGGTWKSSQGTWAAMPLYKAKLKMVERAAHIAKKTFRS